MALKWSTSLFTCDLQGTVTLTWIKLTAIRHDYKPISEMTFRHPRGLCYTGHCSVLPVNRLQYRGEHLGVPACLHFVCHYRGEHECWKRSKWREGQVQVRPQSSSSSSSQVKSRKEQEREREREREREYGDESNCERKHRLQAEKWKVCGGRGKEGTTLSYHVWIASCS